MTADQRLVLHDFFTTPDGGGKVAAILAEAFHADLMAGYLEMDAFPEGYFGKRMPVSVGVGAKSSR